MKLAKNARLVMEVVDEQAPGAHATALDIVRRARGRSPRLGVSTVYRALDRLTEAGLVHAVRVPGAASVLYEAARQGHAHFLCTRCGGVQDIPYRLPAADLASLDAAHGVAVATATVTFEGLCSRCKG